MPDIVERGGREAAYQGRTKDGPHVMPRNFYILRDERDWWAVSESPNIPESGASYRSRGEAFDQLRSYISGKGLIVGQTYPDETGFRVEALEPREVADRAPMLYSSPAIKLIEDLKERFGRMLKQSALDLAKREGRKLITSDDVWAIAEKLNIPIIDEEP